MLSEGKSFSRNSRHDQSQRCSGRSYATLSCYKGKEIYFGDRTKDFWSDSLLMIDTYTEFYKYIDYQMMISPPYIAQIRRLSLGPTEPDLPPQVPWTTSFYPPTASPLDMGPMTTLNHSLQDPCEDFRLTPIEAGSKGHELSLMFADWREEYGFVIKPSEFVFTDGYFKPTHMGGPTAFSRCEGKREELVEREAARIRKAKILREECEETQSASSAQGEGSPKEDVSWEESSHKRLTESVWDWSCMP